MYIWNLHPNNEKSDLFSCQVMQPLTLISPKSGASFSLTPFNINSFDQENHYLIDMSILNNPKHLSEINKSNCTLYIVANKLECDDLSLLSLKLTGIEPVYVYLDTGLDNIDFYQKIKWISSRVERVCLCSSQLDRLLFFSLLNPHSIFCDLPSGEIESLKAMLNSQKNRPVAVSELDDSEKGSWTLSSICDLEAGDHLSQEILKITQSTDPGLPPRMLDKLNNVVLRYSLKKGEPIMFGHLYIGNDPGEYS